jgi:hypothetical protein
MKSLAAAVVLSGLVVVSGCSPIDSNGFSRGEIGACSGVTVEVNYGTLSDDHFAECVEFEGESALATEVLAFAGVTTEGTEAYGDLVVCRVNDLPSDEKEIVVEGEEPYLETCAEMPPAFAYWALWQKPDQESPWDYAMEGVGTLMVMPGSSLGLAFSSGDDVVMPSIEP